MNDEKDTEINGLILSSPGEIAVRSTSLVRRGLQLMNIQQPQEHDADFWHDMLRSTEADALLGDADAQYCLGWHYHAGAGYPQDDTQAAFWYRKAAEQGQVEAQYYLSGMYVSGRGVQQDDSEAAR